MCIRDSPYSVQEYTILPKFCATVNNQGCEIKKCSELSVLPCEINIEYLFGAGHSAEEEWSLTEPTEYNTNSSYSPTFMIDPHEINGLTSGNKYIVKNILSIPQDCSIEWTVDGTIQNSISKNTIELRMDENKKVSILLNTEFLSKNGGQTLVEYTTTSASGCVDSGYFIVQEAY